MVVVSKKYEERQVLMSVGRWSLRQIMTKAVLPVFQYDHVNVSLSREGCH